MVQLKAMFFKRKPCNDLRFADSLYEIMDQSNFRPDRFNDCEPVRKSWEERDLFRRMWMEQSSRFFGTMITDRKKKPKISSIVYLEFGPKAKCHCISLFGLDSEKVGPTTLDDLIALGDQLFEALELDYGFMCSDGEYHASNIYEHLGPSGLLQYKKVVGMEWPDCIPGLFTVNYFGDEYFKQGMPRFAIDSNCVALANGVRLTKSNKFSDWNSESSTQETARLINEIGSEWFFTKETGMPARSLKTDKSLFRYPPGGPQEGFSK
jgi:hypothetical protein